MENLINILLDNKTWIFSGLVAASVSIFANVFTNFILSRKKRDINVTIRIKNKDGKEYTINVGDYESDEKVMDKIRSIKGSDFIDYKPNK